MPPVIDVTCTLWLDQEHTCPIMPSRTTALPAWAAIPTNAEEVVKTLCREWLDESAWEDWFDAEDTQTIWVTMTTPPWLRGCYEVTLRRTIQVEARKLTAQQPESSREED
jgi:hypothetical protein